MPQYLTLVYVSPTTSHWAFAVERRVPDSAMAGYAPSMQGADAWRAVYARARADLKALARTQRDLTPTVLEAKLAVLDYREKSMHVFVSMIIFMVAGRGAGELQVFPNSFIAFPAIGR